MARRHGNKPSTKRSKPRPVDRKDSSIKRWNKPSDIPMDEEDQFHASRDQILLDGEGAQSDDEGEEEEVFALKGIPDNSEDEESDEEEGNEEDEDYEKLPSSKVTKSKQSKSKQQADSPPLSDEGSESEEEEEGWGGKKSAYYSSNAAELDSEDEEANEMEEQEAKRLQAKLRESMADEDFGLGDIAEADIDEQTGEFEEPAPSVQLQSLPQDKHGLLRHLQKTNPEALALAGDWDNTARQLIKIQEQIELLETDHSVDALQSGMLHLYYQTLLQYAATLAFYLYLRVSDKYIQHPESLRSHPIMSRLLTLKQSISTFESLGIGEDDDDDEEDDSLDSDENGDDLFAKFRGLAPSELDQLLVEVEAMKAEDPQWAAANGKNSHDEEETTSKKAKSKKNKTRAAAIGEDEPPKKKRKTDKKEKSSSAAKLPVFDLEEPEFPTSSKSKSKASATLANGDSTDNFGEFTTLQAADAQDKAARKRSLRFHTSKIESASARRDKARTALGGDDDIPWRDRKKDKDEKAKKALAKSRGQGGEDLDDEEPEPRQESNSGKKRRREEEGSGSDGEGDDAAGYYNLVQRKSKEKKEKKKAEYEAAQAALRENMYDDESADGPRSVSRAILANKGLTPKRSKSVRNPRVKKRQRYEKAKKKVSSQKAVYKGGLAATGKYEGEKSGISKVIKGVRLS
ncbi:Sas10 C-terminal domain-containing protein [Irpex rosettiformis]|uniref:Sas10 C-terminal domain-containing protein n=1 Tax=Irpex rosettiformis TaxID=378272 RepID=A0ACB8TSJ3_9APHY|nr:Sas10 C-terminal domain-containing protein [Irpex rosettiformis]